MPVVPTVNKPNRDGKLNNIDWFQQKMNPKRGLEYDHLGTQTIYHCCLENRSLLYSHVIIGETGM